MKLSGSTSFVRRAFFEDLKMAGKKKKYDDSDNREYDNGSAGRTGDLKRMPPGMQEAAKRPEKAAFPEGKEVFLKQREQDRIDKIVLKLDNRNYPLILRQMGPEAAKEQVIKQCIQAGWPVTRENLEGLLTNLEETLEESVEGPVDDPQ